MREPFDIELFIQHERDAAKKATTLRLRGFTVEMHEYSGGYGHTILGPATAMEELYQEVVAERRAQEGQTVTGTVRWWKDEKGYGRITGDDGYIYFCHCSDLQMEGYKTLRPGQRVEFERVEGISDHGRAGAVNVRVI